MALTDKKRRLFHRHRSQGPENAIEDKSLPISPEPVAEDRRQSAGSEFVFDKASPSALEPTSFLPIDRRTTTSIRSPSPGRRSTLGLHLVHQPSETPCLDIIFIHGLGGDSLKTWSKDHNPELFWPGLWLPFETDLERARIFTFGYNANFRPNEAKSVSNITDFAKELLFELQFGKTQEGDTFGIGKMPLIFVAHSMGGLLAKKACLLGQNDEHYQALVRSISAIIFLSTPHRGSNLAEVLNRVLTASFQSARNYIKDLNKGSTALEEINEQFRHIAPRLSIWSFYETLPTLVGPKKMMVLEKESAILGYSKEVSRPLYADHHGVCKYSSPEDVNYVSVRNALGTLVEEIARKVGVSADQAIDEFQTLQGLFPSSLDYDDDLDKYSRLRIDGTCEWILSEDGMSDWTNASDGCHFVWLGAAPASGKSVMSAHVATSLQQRGLAPQYFFFNFGDQQKRSVSNLLRSIACQIAKENRRFRRGLLDLSKQGLRMDKADAFVLWHKVYENLLFKLDHRQPLFWIIDALDECDSPKLLFDLIRTCPGSNVPLRIFIASRQTEPIQMGVAKASRSMRLTKLEKHSSDHNAQDIQRLVEQEVSHMRGSEKIKSRVIQEILARADGNFLWTRLVLEEIIHCQTRSGIEEILDELPSDMHELYERMEHAILELPRKSSRLLAKTLLRWTVGARRPMSLRELSQALETDFSEILDLKMTIFDVCGQFVRVDASDHVALIHQTAREYLTQPRGTELFIDVRTNHEALCIKTVSALLDSSITLDMIDDASPHSYLLYAATSWSYHLKSSKSTSSKVFDILLRFFSSRAFPSWVHLLAITNHLNVLVKTSKSLALFTTSIRKADELKNPMQRRLSDLQLLDQWAIDLMRIVAKFSTSLLKYPRAIYSLVSAFSPETSALQQQPYCKNGRGPRVVGGLDSAWTDRLARISLPEGFEAYKLACAGRFVAALGAKGLVSLWNSQSFANVHVIEHNEPVTSIALNAQGDKLVTYGLQTTKIWAVPSGKVLSSVDNIDEVKAMTLSFVNDDTRIVAGFDDRAVRYFDTKDIENGWHFVHPRLFKEPLSAEAAANSPTSVGFSRSGLYAGVAYRGFPLSVWSMESGECINRCNRAQGINFSADQYSAGWYVVWRFVWNPVTDHVIGFYTDGFVFKWHPLTGEHHETQASANDVAASSDGKLFLSSTSTGIIKVWDFDDFSVIYQLSSDDLLVGIAFSPDSLRFYDLRCGMVNSVNAWEPNSLLRFSDAEETVSDLASENAVSISIAQASEACLEQFEAISALGTCPNGKCVCVGTDDGSIELRSTNGLATVKVGKFNNFMEVSHLAWSQDSQYLVAADLSGDIIIRQIQTTDYTRLAETTRIASLTNPKVRLDEQAIHEILFSPDASMLLIVTSQSGHIWSLTDINIRASEQIPDSRSRTWLRHPTQHQLFLGIGSSDVRVFRWQDFRECSEPVSYLHIAPVQQHVDSSPDVKGYIDTTTEALASASIAASVSTSEGARAMVTQDLEHLLVRVSSSSSSTGFGRFFVVPLSEMDTIKAGFDHINTDSTVIRSIPISDEVRPRVRIPLGILPGNRFVFLDWELWVCSYRIDASTDRAASSRKLSTISKHVDNEGDDLVQHHYFVPEDWAMGGSLDLCYMTADGTLVYPRDDKVSMIKAELSRPAWHRGSSTF